MNRKDLQDYYYSQKWIEEMMQRYKEQKQKAEELKAVYIDGMPKAKNKPNDAIEELLDKYDDIIRILIKDQEKQNEIIKRLRLMQKPYKNILTLKYIEGKSLEEIATEVNFSYYETCRKHGEALNQFDNLDKEIKESNKTQDNAKKNVLL